MVGVNGENIIFTSNNTSEEEFEYALANNVIINLDDITHIKKLERVGIPDIICCRFNPGDLKE
jgi:diaminopimelate decarboxylase